MATLAATTTATPLSSVFETIVGFETQSLKSLVPPPPSNRRLAAPVSVVGGEFTPYDQSQTLGAVCQTTADDDDEEAVSGIYGLKWMDDLSLSSDCVPDEETCKDLSPEGCDFFYKEAKTLKTLMGWDGETTLNFIYNEVKDWIPEDKKPDIETVGDDTIIEGYNLNHYRLGDVCPKTAKMCDEEITATFTVDDSLGTADALKDALRRQACISANFGYWKVGNQGSDYTIPDLDACKFKTPEEETGGDRRLAATDVSVRGSLISMNELLSSITDSNSNTKKLTDLTDSGFNILTPSAVYSTDKKTNEGSGMNVMTLAIIILLILLLICCCCCFCCCRYVCKCCCTPKPKNAHHGSESEMVAVVN
jgi:hypothetical protein